MIRITRLTRPENKLKAIKGIRLASKLVAQDPMSLGAAKTLVERIARGEAVETDLGCMMPALMLKPGSTTTESVLAILRIHGLEATAPPVTVPVDVDLLAELRGAMIREGRFEMASKIDAVMS